MYISAKHKNAQIPSYYEQGLVSWVFCLISLVQSLEQKVFCLSLSLSRLLAFIINFKNTKT
jgi:hypothetical protein